MTESPIGQLALALSKAQGELHAAQKTSVNPHFKSKFADLSEIWLACRDALSKHKIAVIQSPQFDDKDSWLETILCHESGERMVSRMLLKNAKGDMQGLGSAISYARRYCLAAMVGVIAGDDDGEAACVPSGPSVPAAKKVGAPFDLKNREHTDALQAVLLKRKITGDWSKNVFSAMVGKPFTELENVIKASNPESAGEI